MSNDHTENQNLLVAASAGSGKTYALTNRYIKCVLRGESPSSLLATTFTKAAAGEILHRVLLRISAAITKSAALSDLSKALKIPSLTQEDCIHALQTIVHEFPRLSVMTIDALFARMTSSFAPELGLPAAFRLLSDEENDQLRDDCIDDAIDECSVPEMYTLLRALQGHRLQMNTHSSLKNLVSSAYATFLASAGSDSSWSAIDTLGSQLSKNDLAIISEQLRNASLPATKAGTPYKIWVTAMDNSIQAIDSQDWNLFFKSKLTTELLKPEDPGYEPKFSSQSYPQDILEALTQIIEHAKYELTNDHNNSTKATYELMSRYDKAYRAKKMSTGQIGFDDPPRLLQEAAITGDLEHLYYRLDSSINHVMLDEFQDTSIPQFNLIEPVLDEILSQTDASRSAFIVGDAKQSLYSWREAEPKLLGALKEHWQTISEETLTMSWRSSPVVLDTVNTIFDALINNAALMDHETAKHTAQSWNQHYRPHTAAKPDLPGNAELIVANSDQDDDANPTDEVLWECASKVADARSQSPDASIAVLVRHTKNIYPLLSMLKKLGIDACEDRGNPLVDAPCVAAMTSLLKLIDHPSDTAALYHVLHSPIAPSIGLDDPAKIHSITTQLRDRIASQGCVPFLTETLEHCAQSMDHRGFIRFEQLIELTAELESEGHTGASTIANFTQTKKVDDPGTATVQVMTIHASKGLEFDCVVIPVLGHFWSLKSDSMISARDQQLGPVSIVTKYPNKLLRELHPALDRMYSHAMQRQVNEELCCLYVAMTRAKHCLQLIIPATKDGRSGNPESKFSLKPAHVVHASLAPSSPCEPGETIYQKRSPEPWYESINANTEIEQHPDPESTQSQSTIELSVQPATKLKTGLMGSLSPSALKNEKSFLLSGLLKQSALDPSSKEFGDRVHAAFENIDWIPTNTGFDFNFNSDSKWIESLIETDGSSPEHERLLLELENAFNSTQIREEFDHSRWLKNHPSCNTARVYHERPFAIPNPLNPAQLIQGRIDRLVIGSNTQGPIVAQIVDYKTDRATAGLTQTELITYAKRHADQMIAYQNAVAHMYSLEPSAIEVDLMYTANSGVVRL